MLYTVAEVAAKKKTTKFSVHRWIKSGLKTTSLYGRLLVDAKDLAAFTPRKAGNPGWNRKRK